MSANPTTSVVTGVASILTDIENGEALIPLSELGSQPFVLKSRGRKPHNSVWFRWVSHGLRGVKLEAIRAGTCLATTRQRP